MTEVRAHYEGARRISKIRSEQLAIALFGGG